MIILSENNTPHHYQISRGNERTLKVRTVGFVAIFLILFMCFACDSLAASKTTSRDARPVKNPHSNIYSENDGRVRFVPDNLFGSYYINEKTGWLSGYYGTVLKTIDGGENWQHISIPHTDLIRSIEFHDENSGWLVTHRGRIMKSDDGGVNWETKFQIPNINLRNIRFIDQETGWAVGHEGTILHTNDAGESWSVQSLANYTGRDLPRLNALAIIDKKTAFLAGEFGTIASTFDGGNTWNVIPTGDNKATYTDMAVSSNSLIIVGLNGVAIEINDVSDSSKLSIIRSLETNTKSNLFGVNLNELGNGYIVGQATVIHMDAKKQLRFFEGNIPGLEFQLFTGLTNRNENSFVLVGAQGLVLEINAESKTVKKQVKW